MPIDLDKAALNRNGSNGSNSIRDEAIARPDRAPTPQSKEETAARGEIESIQASQAQDDAAKALELAVQAKASALQDAATREASQAAEEIMVGMQAYAATLLQGTEAMVQAKAAIREGLNQAVSAKPVAVDFSNFFRLPSAAKNAIAGEK